MSNAEFGELELHDLRLLGRPASAARPPLHLMRPHEGVNHLPDPLSARLGPTQETLYLDGTTYWRTLQSVVAFQREPQQATPLVTTNSVTVERAGTDLRMFLDVNVMQSTDFGDLRRLREKVFPQLKRHVSSRVDASIERGEAMPGVADNTRARFGMMRVLSRIWIWDAIGSVSDLMAMGVLVAAQKTKPAGGHLTLPPPSVPPRKRSQRVVTTWYGVVLSVAGETFTARLSDPSERQPGVEIEIYRDEVPMPDTPLLRPGSHFYWIITAIDRPNGDRVRESQIKFRRVERLTDDDLANADERAGAMRRAMGVGP
jgi:hypothetical protein